MKPASCTKYHDAFERIIDRALDERERGHLAEHMEECSGCREEYEWLHAVGNDLEALGDAILRKTPPIDVVDAVMAEISFRKSAPKPAKVLHFQAPAQPRTVHLGWVGLVGLAAALALVAGVWAFLPSFFGAGVESPKLAEVQDTKVPSSPPDLPAAVPFEAVAPPDPISEVDEGLSLAEGAQETGPERRMVSPARDTILAAFRKSLESDQAALSDLIDWASLEPEQAQALIANPGVSAQALAGASRSLSGPEAASALLTAVGHLPEEPSLRYRLARAYGVMGRSGAEAGEQLAALAELDPENALVHYLNAQRYLEADPPDIVAALEAFAAAQNLETASAYAIEGARFREEALIESGTDPEVAQLLGALTAGRWENDELTAFASDLIATGQRYQESGDTETASSVFLAALELGRQLDSGADLSQERLAALDIQSQAIGALRSLEREDDDVLLTIAAEDLYESTWGLREYFSNLGLLFAGDLDDVLLRTIGEIILEHGDLGLLEAIGDFLF